jgi:hypothetical protein
MAYRDRTPDDPPIAWEVVVEVELPEIVEPQRFAGRFIKAVAGHPATSDPECGRQAALPLARFLVRASTWEEAQSMANDVQQDALRAAFAEVPPSKDGIGLVTSVRVEPARDDC